jgi:hypothetical protein
VNRRLVAAVLLTLIGAAPAAACPRTSTRGLHDRLVASDAWVAITAVAPSELFKASGIGP